jgi:hypothetical protein
MSPIEIILLVAYGTVIILCVKIILITRSNIKLLDSMIRLRREFL